MTPPALLTVAGAPEALGAVSPPYGLNTIASGTVVQASAPARYLPGCLAEHLTSCGAIFNTASQTKLSSWISAGATGKGVELSERDRWICAQVGPALREQGLVFVGLDVIGDYLTEINVTSPTCIRELDAQFDLNISAGLFDEIEKRCIAKSKS